MSAMSIDNSRERASGQVCEIDMTEQINQRGCALRVHQPGLEGFPQCSNGNLKVVNVIHCPRSHLTTLIFASIAGEARYASAFMPCQFPADRAEFSHVRLLNRDGHGLAEEANGRPPAVNWQDRLSYTHSACNDGYGKTEQVFSSS